MNKNKLFYLITVLILAFTAIGVFYIKQKTDNSYLQEEKLNGDQTDQSVSADFERDSSQESKYILINFGQGREINAQTNAGTAYEALRDVADKNDISVETKEYKFGLMVEAIDNVSNSQDSFWSYKVNGETAKIASDRYLIYPGDKIEWEYSQ